MIPQSLINALEECKLKCTADPGGHKMPKIMYVNPTGKKSQTNTKQNKNSPLTHLPGSNPTGTTMPLERRQEIYRICCQYNILILEDDAYCFMHFLEENVPSFLSMDTEGRVLRFDSFSKVLSSGLRLGWVTGPKPLVKIIEMHIQSSYLHSSTLSQVRVVKSFWG